MIWRVLIPCLFLIGCSLGAPSTRPALLTASTLQLRTPDFAPRFEAATAQNTQQLQVGFIDLGVSTNLRLEHQNGAFTYWISPEGGHLIFQSGLLHGTHGFGEGLLASDLNEALTLINAQSSGNADRFHTYLDGNDQAITRTFRCRIENEGRREIELRSGPVNTVLMAENCRSLDADFVNFYWVMPASGVIVQSRQWAGPEVGQISTRIVPI